MNGGSPAKRGRSPSSEGSSEEPPKDIPVNIWTRDGHMVDDVEADLLDLQFSGTGPDVLFYNKYGLTEGLEVVPTRPFLPHDIPSNVRPRNIFGNNLPRSSMVRAGSRLQHAMEVVAMVVDGPMVFKIGITTNPVWRWSQYEKESVYQGMVLVDFSTLPGRAPMLEASLISAFSELRRWAAASTPRTGCSLSQMYDHSLPPGDQASRSEVATLSALQPAVVLLGLFVRFDFFVRFVLFVLAVWICRSQGPRPSCGMDATFAHFEASSSSY